MNYSNYNKDNKAELSIIMHLKELRYRISLSLIFFLFIFGICYYWAADIYNFLLAPLADLVINSKKDENFKLIYTGLTETFTTYLRVSFLASLLIATPFFLWQFYLFIMPGLYKREKTIILPYLISSPILFLIGNIIVYYYIFPLAWKFFLSFEYEGAPTGALPIEFLPSVAEYLNLVVQLMFAFGIAFQLPVLLVLLSHVGVLDYQSLIKKRRMAIVLIFIIAAFLTPPDVLSQIGLAIPMILLYEASIIICKYISRKKKNNINNMKTNNVKTDKYHL